MKKIILSLIVVTSSVLMPYAALAQLGGGPPDECKMTKELTAGQWRVQHSFDDKDNLFTLYRDVNGDGAFTDTPDERINMGGTFPNPNGKDFATKDFIVIPRTAIADQANVKIKQGDILPPIWGTFCLINTVTKITDWIFFILLTIAFAFVALAGFEWITSQGNAEKQKTAASMIYAALVGIVIAVIAKIIPAVIVGILT